MSSTGSANKVVITQLVVDASGAKTGVADFEAALEKARDSAAKTEGGISSFDSVLNRWTKSLAATDPVLRAQVAQQQALQRQLDLNNQAVKLGITTQEAANAQLARVNQKYGEYLNAAKSAGDGQSGFSRILEYGIGVASGYLAVLAPERVAAFGAQLFQTAALLKAQAEQVAESTDALQAQRAALQTNGIEAAQTDQILSRLTHSIGDAQRQAGAARDDFNQLGISVGTLKGGAEQTLPALAQALLKIENPAQRAALEVDLLGRSGQRLESALRTLADPTANLIDKEKALGQVLGRDVADKADEAANRLTEAGNRIKTELTPVVVDLVTWLLNASDAAAKLVGNASTTASGLPAAVEQAFPGYAQDVQARAAAAAGAANAKRIADANGSSAFGFPVVGAGVVYGTGVHAGQAVGQAANDNSTYSDTALQEYIAKQRISASIAAEGPVEQAKTNELINAANIKLASGAGLSAEQLAHFTNSDGTMRKFVTTTGEAVNVLGQATAKEVEGLGAAIARGAEWNKLKETFAGYLGSLNEEARVAGEGTAQRETELAIIKAAQVAQRAKGDAIKDQVKTYDQALGKLDAQQIQEVQLSETAKQSAAFHKATTDQLTLANAAAANGRDDRELALSIAQKELELGRQLTGEEAQQLRLIQQKTDASRLRDYTDQLKDEVSLAGLSADERERQAGVLTAMRITHGQLLDSQKQEIEATIATRQETDRWRQVVDGVAGSFQGFFQDLLTKGKASFGDLARAIQAQFVQLLAWMASQALIQPIIVPMVGEMAGAFGLQMPGGMGGGGLFGGGPNGSGGLSLLANGASLANSGGLFGSSSGGMLGGIGSSISGGISSLGGFLGFDSAIGGTAGAAIPLSFTGATGATLSAGTISSGLPSAIGSGSIFGTSLGGFMGGAGLGALAGNLVFGNKNDASMGSMGGALAGAAIGSIIPGVGTIIGGLIGGLAGGGLGSMTGSSNQGAIANFTNGGAGNVLFKAGGGNNSQLTTGAASTISQAIATLKQSGVDVSLGNITGLSIGSDKSYIYDSAGGKQKLAGGDAGALVSAVLDRILPSASGSTPEAQAIMAKYASQGGINASNLSQFESDLGSAKNFADSLANLKQSDATLTDAGQKLDAINQQYNQLVDQAQQLGLDVSSLTDAKNGAISNLLDGYLAQLDAFTPPTEQASQWKQAMDAIAKSEANATEAANALGSGLDRVQSAADGARQSVANTFDSQITGAIGKLADPVGQAFDELIASQQQRLTDAQTVSANIDQVNRLSNLELTQFFQGLTPDQLGLLGQERGLYGNGGFGDALTAANDLQALSGSLGDLTQSAQDAASAASQAASNWGSAHDSLAKASTALLVSDQSLSPTDQYKNSAAQFNSLRTAAFGGDVSAASDLASYAGDFLKTSFNYNGSTTAYGQDLSYVQNTLNSLASYAGGQQSLAQQQASSAAQAVTVLQAIKQTISDQKTETVQQLQALASEVADLADQINTANLYARHA